MKVYDNLFFKVMIEHSLTGIPSNFLRENAWKHAGYLNGVWMNVRSIKTMNDEIYWLFGRPILAELSPLEQREVTT